MMTETVVTVQDAPGHNSNPRQTGVKTEPGQAHLVSGMAINTAYFLTIPGMLKGAQLIFGIICMACASPAWFSATSFFLAVVVIAFIATLIWTFVYFLSIRESQVLNLRIDWILSELLNTAVITVLYLISSILHLAHSGRYGPYIAGGVFGLFNTIAYGAGTYFLFLERQSSRSTQ